MYNTALDGAHPSHKGHSIMSKIKLAYEARGNASKFDKVWSPWWESGPGVAPSDNNAID